MFPERLRALRTGQKITLQELADALNAHRGPGERPNTPSQIGNWERGIRTPSYVEVRKLAEYFNVSLDYLTGRVDHGPTDLAKLFLANQELTFNQRGLSSADRYEIFQLIDGYFKGRDNRRDTATFYGKQEELQLNFKDDQHEP